MPRPCWEAYDALTPLVGWGGKHPSHFPSSQRLHVSVSAPQSLSSFASNSIDTIDAMYRAVTQCQWAIWNSVKNCVKPLECSSRCHPRSSALKIKENRWGPGLCPETHSGAYRCSPDLLAGGEGAATCPKFPPPLSALHLS